MKHTYEIKGLKNDSELLVINVPNSQVAGFSIGVKAGYYFTSSNKNELAHLVEHLMFEGNSDYNNGDQLAYELEKNGILQNGHTSGSFMSFEYVFGKDFVKNAITLALKQLTSPTFREDYFEKEKKVIVKELEPDLDNPYYDCHFGLLNSITEEEYSVKERIGSLKNIKKKDVEDYYKKYFVSKNTKFVLFGSFKKSEINSIIKVIEKGLTEYSTGEKKKVIYPKLKNYKNKIIVTESKKAERNCFDISFVNSQYPPAEDKPAINIFYTIYNKGTYSRIFRKIREKGVGYSFASGYRLGRNYSELYLTDKAFNEDILGLFDLSVRELKDILEGNITDKEFERAKGYLLGEHERNYNTPGDFANWYTPEFADDEKLFDFDDYLELLKKATKKDVIRAANSFIKEDDWVLSITGPDVKKLEPEFVKILKKYFN